MRGELPPYRYTQAELTDTFAALVSPDPRARALIERFHASAQVATRHLCLPRERLLLRKELTDLDIELCLRLQDAGGGHL